MPAWVEPVQVAMTTMSKKMPGCASCAASSSAKFA
jgi:hypothetical protein